MGMRLTRFSVMRQHRSIGNAFLSLLSFSRSFLQQLIEGTRVLMLTGAASLAVQPFNQHRRDEQDMNLPKLHPSFVMVFSKTMWYIVNDCASAQIIIAFLCLVN